MAQFAIFTRGYQCFIAEAETQLEAEDRARRNYGDDFHHCEPYGTMRRHETNPQLTARVWLAALAFGVLFWLYLGYYIIPVAR